MMNYHIFEIVINSDKIELKALPFHYNIQAAHPTIEEAEQEITNKANNIQELKGKNLTILPIHSVFNDLWEQENDHVY